MASKTILLTFQETNNRWGHRYFIDGTMEMFDSQDRVLNTYKWKMEDQTVYLLLTDKWWPADSHIDNEDDRCAFYADLFYAIAEQELLS